MDLEAIVRFFAKEGRVILDAPGLVEKHRDLVRAEADGYREKLAQLEKIPANALPMIHGPATLREAYREVKEQEPLIFYGVIPPDKFAAFSRLRESGNVNIEATSATSTTVGTTTVSPTLAALDEWRRQAEKDQVKKG